MMIASSLLGLFGFLVLVFLPGAWITFGLRLTGLPFWARLCTAAMLAPVVVAAQFYALRLIGVPFEVTAVLLALVNLPALYLVFRRWSPVPRPDRRTILAIGLVTLVILTSTAPFLIDAQKRLYTWEAWSQGDVVYALANGQLDVQDAELAGVRLSYPWAGHVYQAVLSFMLGSPPVENYIWSNLVWVPLTFAFLAGIVAHFGGNRLSRVTVAMWASFGVNIVGYLLGQIFPTQWIRAYPVLGTIWGDNRYTPFLDKIVFFGQMWFALGMFSAIIYLLVRGWPDESRRSYVALIGLLLAAIGIVYPVLLPPALTVVGARALVVLLRQYPNWHGVLRTAVTGEVPGLAIGVLVTAIVTFAQVKFLTDGRASPGLVQLNDLYHVRWTFVESAIVLSPLLMAFLLGIRKYWRKHTEPLVILGLGAFISCALYATFDIPWYRNEYKFIFTAALCLAPFPSLMLERTLERLGRMAIPAVALLAGGMAAPLAYHVYAQTYTLYTREGPLTDNNQFDLRLANREPLAAITNAIRNETPSDSLLVVAESDVHLPTLTRRQLYVAPLQSQPDPGILITSDQMLTLVKDYPQTILDARRATLSELFSTHDQSVMTGALQTMLNFSRPLAVIVNENTQLEQWFTSEGIGKELYAGEGRQLWLIQPDDGGLARAAITNAHAGRESSP